MATRQYKGARYIPVFAEPVEWDNSKTYEYLTMVQHVGETYMSKQNVPIGASLPDTSQGEESNEFWVHMSNWNAQVETYRQEVLQYNDRISTVENDLPITDFNSENTVKDNIDNLQEQIGEGFTSTNDIATVIGNFDSTSTVENAINGINELIPSNSFSSSNTVKDAIDDIADIIPATSFDSTNTVKKYIDDTKNTAVKKHIVFIGDSWTANGSLGTSVGYLLGKTAHTYQQVGCGFVQEYNGKTFISLVNDAIADTTYDHDLVTDVIIVGGINDTSYIFSEATNHAIGEAIRSISNAVKGEFTNAKLTIIGGALRGGASYFNHQYIMAWLGVKEYVNGNVLVDFSTGFTLCPINLYNSDGLHPSTIGYSVVANNIVNIMYGNPTTPSYKEYDITKQNDTLKGAVKIEIFNDGWETTVTLPSTTSPNGDWYYSTDENSIFPCNFLNIMSVDKLSGPQQIFLGGAHDGYVYAQVNQYSSATPYVYVTAYNVTASTSRYGGKNRIYCKPDYILS